MGELMAKVSFMEKKHSSRYESYVEEEYVAKSRENFRVLEDLERTPFLGKNKAQLPPPGTAYWEIKHHGDITQQGNE